MGKLSGEATVIFVFPYYLNLHQLLEQDPYTLSCRLQYTDIMCNLEVVYIHNFQITHDICLQLQELKGHEH